MTQPKTRKQRTTFTVEQKLDYAKLMVNENYTNKHIMEISGAGPTAVTRWKKQYLAELNGQTPKNGKAMTPEQQEIQSLKKQLWRAKRDNALRSSLNLKKGNRLVRHGQSLSSMIAKMNKAYRQYNTKELCHLFDHARSSYYYQVQDKPMDNETQSIIKSMKQISLETGYTYGRRRLQRQLNANGFNIGSTRTVTLVRKANIRAIKPKRRHYYPNTGRLHKRADNLLKRDFNQQKSNTHWVGDITYIKTYQGWSYLASVLDLASRQVVGWALSKQPNAKLAKDALDNAINRYKPNADNLMFHSDQGAQYSSKDFIDYCSNNKITQSMSRKGNCWDSAVMERFFRSLKTERLNYQSFANHYEVIQNVERYIYFYNYKRIHSAIGYLTPAQKMAELEKVA